MCANSELPASQPADDAPDQQLPKVPGLLEGIATTVGRDAALHLARALVRTGTGAFGIEFTGAEVRMPGPVDSTASPMERVTDDPGGMINYRSIALARKGGHLLHGAVWVLLPAEARRTLQGIVMFGQGRLSPMRSEEMLSGLEEGANIMASCVLSRLSAVLGTVVHQTPSKTAIGVNSASAAAKWRQNFGVGPMIALQFAVSRPGQSDVGFTVVLEIQGLEMLAGLARLPKHCRVLLVDDNEFTRNLIERTLESIGMEVRDVATGTEAVVAYGSEPTDIVVLDVVLPDRSGPQVLQEILAIDPKAKVLMVSADEQESLVRSCLRLGARGYMTKPVSPARLIAEVRRVLVEP